MAANRLLLLSEPISEHGLRSSMCACKRGPRWVCAIRRATVRSFSIRLSLDTSVVVKLLGFEDDLGQAAVLGPEITPV